MKLTKTSWLLLMVGVFTIAFAGLGMAYSKQNDEQSSLNQKLAQTQLILSKSSPDKLSLQKEELEGRLAQAQSQMEEAKVILSLPEESIEASDSLFDIAEICGVDVVEIRSSPPTSIEQNGAVYSTFSLAVKLEGDVPNIIHFVLKWTEEYPTGVVKSVRINVPEVASAEEEEAGEEVGETGEEEEEAGEEVGETGEEEEETGEEVGETGEEEEETGEEVGETGEEEEEAGEEVGETGEEEAGEEEETGDEAEEIEPEPQKPSASISLVIYTYRGD